MSKEHIVLILMKRDNMPRREALEMVEECQAEINEIINDSDNALNGMLEIEGAIQDHLGLEPDFVMDFLG